VAKKPLADDGMNAVSGDQDVTPFPRSIGERRTDDASLVLAPDALAAGLHRARIASAHGFEENTL
jgi:hypothetical protein